MQPKVCRFESYSPHLKQFSGVERPNEGINFLFADCFSGEMAEW